MGLSQSCSTLNRLALGGREPFARTRTRKPGRIASRVSPRLNSDIAPAPRSFNKDWAAVQEAIAGNRLAQENLFVLYMPRLYRIAFTILRNKEDAEDAVQNGLVQAYLKLRSFQGRSSFSTWLTRIVMNSALMLRRKRNAHPEASLDEMLNGQPEWFVQVADKRSGPEKVYFEIELNARVEEQLRQLSPAMQTAFRLQVRHGFSISESTRALGISASTFKSRVLRARQKVARAVRHSEKTPGATQL